MEAYVHGLNVVTAVKTRCGFEASPIHEDDLPTHNDIIVVTSRCVPSTAVKDNEVFPPLLRALQDSTGDEVVNSYKLHVTERPVIDIMGPAA